MSGGPAFPVELRAAHAQGMTLRDWFAGQALVGLLGTGTALSIALRAYQLADAMLAARQAQTEGKTDEL